ncbi:MAG: hypothetical protein NEA02_15740 [Thermoanaerobaculia bacterium]|nr:hypothetical protein [Thermoanaerobaculia bacterium]
MNVKWLFGRKKPAGPPAAAKEIPKGDERRGPVPPPPRTAHAPGISVFGFDTVPSESLLRLGDGCGGFFLEGEEGKGRAAALLVLEGGGGAGATATSPGDVLIWAAGVAAVRAAQSPSGARTSSLSLEEISRTSPQPHHHTKRDGVAGAAFPGITGLRVLARLPEARLAVLRLGPPPGARWVFRGVRAFAVFSGRLAAFDGDDVKEVRAGALARVADPSATLYLEAGNDAALAVALAAEDFIAALG